MNCDNYLNGLRKQEGIQPIRVLYNVIEDQFKLIKNELIKEYPKANIKNIELKYNTIEIPAISPKINNEHLEVHEVFLSFLWCYIYGLYNSIPIGKRKNLTKQLKRTPTDEEYDSYINKLLDNGFLLLDFAFRLPTYYRFWDKEFLPNPEVHSKEDTITITHINTLYYYSITYILLHEFAHVILSHDPNNQNSQERIQMEHEADDFAIKKILDRVEPKFHESYARGILNSLCALTFCSNNFSGVKFHPDVDIRMKRALELMNFPEDHTSWTIGIWATLMWYNKAGVKEAVFPTAYKNRKEGFYGYFDMIQEIKINHASTKMI